LVVLVEYCLYHQNIKLQASALAMHALDRTVKNFVLEQRKKADCGCHAYYVSRNDARLLAACWDK
jgi:hypothetical protein